MVFRKESRHDAFQRQISALRQQLSADQDEEVIDDAEPMPPLQFSPQQPEPPGEEAMPLTTAPPDTGTDTGVIAAGSTWNGTLRAEGSIHIFGTVEGELHASSSIFVAEGSHVNAQVTANTIIVAGRIGGSIECRDRLEVWPTGYVSGVIHSPSLVIHEGATVDGTIEMRSADQGE